MGVLGFEAVLTAAVLLAIAHLSLKTTGCSKRTRYFADREEQIRLLDLYNIEIIKDNLKWFKMTIDEE